MTKCKGECNGYFSGTQFIKASTLVPLNGWGETIFLSWHALLWDLLLTHYSPKEKYVVDRQCSAVCSSTGILEGGMVLFIEKNCKNNNPLWVKHTRVLTEKMDRFKQSWFILTKMANLIKSIIHYIQYCAVYIMVPCIHGWNIELSLCLFFFFLIKLPSNQPWNLK